MTSEIERAYDRSPYPALTFGLTHPEHLGMLGRLFGVPTADPETCSVLEIGCAAGGNLIPMAIAAPKTRLVGVDISAVHIDQARVNAAAVDVSNVTFVKGDFRELPAELGRFDYVICHGVFAWVTPETQDALLEFISERLAPDGVAYVSYNAFPGHHMVEMVRKLIRTHTAGAPDTAVRNEQGLSVLRFLQRHANATPGDWRAGFLDREIAFMESAGSSLIEHDYFAIESHPVYFVDFIGRAAATGLAYLADSVPWQMYLENQSPDIIEAFEPVEDLVLQGQYLDFVHNTRYRETLLCRKDSAISRDLTSARLRGLHVSSLMASEPGLEGIAQGWPAEVATTRGDTITFSNPILRLLLRRVWHHGITAPTVEQLAGEVASDLESLGLEGPTGEALEQHVREQLLRAYFACAVRLSLRGRPIATALPERPATGRYQRHLAATRHARIPNLANFSYAAVPELYDLLPAMDGTRTVDELRALVPEPIDETLERLVANGFVLVPEAVARYG